MALEEREDMLLGGVKKTPRAPPAPGGALRWRIIVAIFGSMGMAIIYGLKVAVLLLVGFVA